jgi:hypothetical protein
MFALSPVPLHVSTQLPLGGFASNLILEVFIKICEGKPNVGYFARRREFCTLLLRGPKLAQKKCYFPMAKLSRFYLVFAFPRQKCYVNEQHYVIRVLPMAFVPWTVQLYYVFLFVVGKIQCFLISKHAVHIFTIMQCMFETNTGRPAGNFSRFGNKILLPNLIALFTVQ